MYFWKLTNNLRLARNPEGSAASEQMDLRMDDRGEKRTDRAVVKRERKNIQKKPENQRSKENKGLETVPVSMGRCYDKMKNYEITEKIFVCTNNLKSRH